MFDSEDFNTKSVLTLMILHEYLGFTFIIGNGIIEKKLEEGEG